MRAAWIAGAAAVVIAGLAASSPAPADWTAPALVTVSPREQADGISSSALSADGRYLVFAGSLDGVRGILRRDMQTGLTEPVAAADAYGSAAILDASDPSISADGRYVSFTTAVALDPADDANTSPDVYVRDMDASVPADGAACDAAGGSCAYTLVSARDGSAAGLTYAGEGGGAVAAPRQAISADGRRVAFVVLQESDLAGAGTPAGQVAVRDLGARRTTLVSSTRDPATGAMTGRPVPGGAVTGPWAALSADGTTVAWSGTHIGEQAATVGDDPARTSDPYNEPLWRRIGDGPGAPTRRVAGAADPGAPGCPADGTMDDPACRGPYPQLGRNANSTNGLQGGWLARPADVLALPSLSADGRAVAFLGGPPIPPLFTANDSDDLFVADMGDGLPRTAAVRRLTNLTTGGGGDSVTDLSIAPDGRRIAFATNRVAFALSPLFVADPPPARPGLQEVWLADLDGQTLRRLSRTVDGNPSSLPGSGDVFRGATSASFDATGRTIVFDSIAANLVAVDANDAVDAFLVQEHAPPAGTPGRVDITPAPAGRAIPRSWRIALRAVPQKDGTIRLDADAPGAGVLRATVRATVPVVEHVRVKRRGGGRRTVTRRVLSHRQVAVASAVVRAGGLTRLTVRVSRTYKSLVAGRAGLDATATVTFAAPARTTLRDTLAVRFRVTPAKATKKTTAGKTTTKKAKAHR